MPIQRSAKSHWTDRPQIARRKQFARQMQLEKLESRELFSVSPWYGEQSASDWGTQILASFDWAQRNANSTMDLQSGSRFASKEEAKAKLSDMVAKYWHNVLGQSVDSNLAEKYVRSPYSSFLVTDRVAIPIAVELDRGFNIRVSQAFDSPNSASISPKNNQIATVDESDEFQMTSDGYAILAREGTVQIVDVRNANDVHRVASISTGMSILQLHVIGNKLVILSPDYVYPENESGELKSQFVDGSRTNILTYDISDRSKPLFASKAQIDGFMVGSRVVGDRLILSTNKSESMPMPKFIPSVDETFRSGELTDTPIGRFETESEYLARVGDSLISYFLPNLYAGTDGTSVQDLGDWQDLVMTCDNAIVSQAIVTTFDLSGTSLQPLDTEVINGMNAGMEYVDDNSVYLFAKTFSSPTGSTNIAKIDFDSKSGALNWNSVGKVAGEVRDARMVSEWNDKLRVFSQHGQENGNSTEPHTSIDLTILESSQGQLAKIGGLEDIASGQGLYAASFLGDRAVITTAPFFEITNFALPRDPLHGIDLTNPKAPVEKSELEIPGVTTHLQWIDSNHLIGIGYVRQESESTSWFWQISLYDVEDLANPKVMDTWRGTNSIVPNQFGWMQSPLAVQYDPTTKILTVPFQGLGTGTVAGNEWLWNEDFAGWTERSQSLFGGSNAVVFRVDVNQDDPLTEIGSVDSAIFVRRMAVFEDSLIVDSLYTVQAYPLSSFGEVASSAHIGNLAEPLWTTVSSAEPQKLDLISPLLEKLHAKLTKVERTMGEDTLTISEDGMSFLFTPSANLTLASRFDNYQYTIELANGETFSSTVSVSFALAIMNADAVTAVPGEEVVVDVLANDTLPNDAKITWAGASILGAEVKVLDDGRRISYRLPEDSQDSQIYDSVEYRVTTSIGSITGNLSVHLDRPSQTLFAGEILVKARMVAVDSEGNEITTLKKGQAFWLELRASDASPEQQGVFSAYADLQFSSNSVIKSGDVIGGELFKNGVQGTDVALGLTGVGAFSSRSTPIGAGEQTIVRIPMTAKAAGSWTVTAAPTQAVGGEFLLFGSNKKIDSRGIGMPSLTLQVESIINSKSSQQKSDTNQDGVITALDALVVINYLNDQLKSAEMKTAGTNSEGEFSPSDLDVNGDGTVTALDALNIINLLNSNAGVASIVVLGDGEGESSQEVGLPIQATDDVAGHSVDSNLLNILAADQEFKRKGRV